MFLHLGSDVVVPGKEVIGIFDLETVPEKVSLKLLNNISFRFPIEKIGGEPYKSLVLTNNKIYLTPISSLTLKKRWDNLELFYEEEDHR
ncbi:extracellular matrix regulator RemB [Carboxydothermus pertinax]|uniref:DUF370 domain-containing protein n=1 Tax=Carboxydothermus pertinax TaxID=870242 RepID=A0A1L8CT36_9THEO|nr:extracellular matrix/biofilm biosynthesis regulator RemA family protein [Carboxydothermus pertinax]GAV22100.1 hypothetical protein cpu_06100 [Carboxydothermus pertinax]